MLSVLSFGGVSIVTVAAALAGSPATNLAAKPIVSSAVHSHLPPFIVRQTWVFATEELKYPPDMSPGVPRPQPPAQGFVRELVRKCVCQTGTSSSNPGVDDAGASAGMRRYVMETDSRPLGGDSTRHWERFSSAIHGKQWVKVWADHRRWQAAQAAAVEAAGLSPSGAQESVACEA